MIPPNKEAGANTDKFQIPIRKKFLHNLLLKVEGRLSKLRKERFVVNPEFRFWIAYPLKQATLFAAKLYSDDSFYFSARYAWVSPEDAKKLLLYGYARQVMKSGIALIEDEEHALEIPDSKTMDSLGRTVVEALIDAQRVILRKHIEILVNLINFANFDKQESYRIFLSAENLEHFLARQHDFNTFYESQSKNIESSKKMFSERIESDLKTLALKEIWFLRKKWSKAEEPPIFISIRKRYMNALLHATDDEKIVLGTTYNDFFGEFSGSVHGQAGSPLRDQSYRFSALKKNISLVSLLSQHILSRMNQLMGFDDPDDLIARMKKEKTSHAPMLMAKFKHLFQKGDLVLAMDDLCEILESKISAYGYTSCRVRFLTRPPLPDTPDDWLPSAFVIPVLAKTKVRSFLFDQKHYPSLPQEVKDILELMKKENDDELAKYSRKALVDLHKAELLIPMLLKSGYLKKIDLEDEL